MKARHSLLFFLLLVLLWQALVSLRVWPPILLPGPLQVSRYLLAAIGDGTLVGAMLVTLRRLLIGYAIGVLAGLPLGLLTAQSPFCALTLGRIALGCQALPSVCWVPLALLWFGQSESALLFVVVMGTVWSVLLATDGGVRNVPPIYRRAAQTMGSRRWHTWLYVTLPASLPFVVSGVKQGWAFAWRSLMAAEIYVSILSGFGLGHLLHYGRELHAMDQVIGVMLVIMLLGLGADRLVFAPVERYLHRRWGSAG